ncbi:MAG: hypothetical protein PF481_04730 [Bacteroidales bacterium]|jgi:hypothetical protein|nr:hypothetical protein [Bacteroidales bacterium]
MSKLAYYIIILFIAVFFTTITAYAQYKPISLKNIQITKSIPIYMYTQQTDSDFTIHIDIQNISSDTIYYTIQQGRLFIPSLPGYSAMMLLHDTTHNIAPQESQQLIVPALAIEPEKTHKADSLSYSFGGIASDKFIEFASTISPKSLSKKELQTALQIIHQTIPLAALCTDTISHNIPLKQMLANIMNTGVPWYCLLYINIHTKPQTLQGELHYFIADSSSVIINIISSDKDTLMSQDISSLQKPGYYTYKLNLDISHYSSGTYTVELLQNNTVLMIRKKFILQ